MIAYLDTHVMPALAAGKVRQLGPDAARLISKADLLLSPIVLLELEYLYEIKRSRLSARDLYEKVAHEAGVRLCDLPFAQVASAAVAEGWTRDPFDRIIVAQAKTNGFAWLISSDEQIMKNYPRTAW
jgi:PIN domain nuclease of toxin-antitoxin system